MVVLDSRLQRHLGFIEATRAGDGDHTDALLIIDEPTFTGCHVWARPIGGLEDKTVNVIGWREAERALEVLREDRVAWEREIGERPE